MSKAAASAPVSEYTSDAPSGSVAVTGLPTFPVVPSGTLIESAVAVENTGGSFTSVTVTAIEAVPVSPSASVALTVTSYTLSVFASWGSSWSRATIDSAPVPEAIVKSPASAPSVVQVTGAR